MTGPGQWDPLKELLGVQKRMNQLFDSALGRPDFDTQEGVNWTPVSDVYLTPESMILCLELPGLKQEEIELRIDGDDLIVSGERRMQKGEPGEHYHRMERSYGKFSRRFRVPSSVDRDAADASYRDGVLRIVIPRRDGDHREAVRVAIH